MPAWWQELQEVLGHDEHHGFVWKVWASFELPKVQSCAVKVDNDYSAPLAHSSLERDRFMPLPDMQFGNQDYWLSQPQKTLAYVKALQYWVEKALLPISGESHHLVESVLELW